VEHGEADVVGQMEVIDDQHQWLLLRQCREQLVQGFSEPQAGRLASSLDRRGKVGVAAPDTGDRSRQLRQRLR
jgi:hypothetical protein